MRNHVRWMGGGNVEGALGTVALGGLALLGGILTLRAKSLILPGYNQFGMSDDGNWIVQRLSGWLAVGFGALIVIAGLAQFVLDMTA